MKNIHKLLALVALCLLPGTASAATLSLQQVGNSVRVLVDTEGDTVNAFEGGIRISGGAVSVQNVSFSDSIVPFWVERPAKGDLRFAGMVPGGYEGKGARLFLFDLAGKPGAQATLSPEGVSILLNDGLGTSAAVTTGPVQVTLGAQAALAPRDTELPEFIEVVVAQDESIFDGDWFVAYNAQDVGSGIARFEVAEARPGMRERDLVWKESSSPYRLTDQGRGSVVWIKAIDAAGNEAVTSIQPEEASDTLRYALIGIVLLLVLTAVVMAVIRKTRMR